MLAMLQGEWSVKVFTINHGSDKPFENQPDDKTWIRSMCFRDPDGIAFDIREPAARAGHGRGT